MLSYSSSCCYVGICKALQNCALTQFSMQFVTPLAHNFVICVHVYPLSHVPCFSVGKLSLELHLKVYLQTMSLSIPRLHHEVDVCIH